jgi:hypothetical protein
VPTYEEFRQIITLPYSPDISTYQTATIPSGIELQELMISPGSDAIADTFLTILIDNEVLFSGKIPTSGFKIDILDSHSSDKSLPLPRRMTIFSSPESELDNILDKGQSFRQIGDATGEIVLNFIGMWRHPVIHTHYSEYDQRFGIEYA